MSAERKENKKERIKRRKEKKGKEGGINRKEGKKEDDSTENDSMLEYIVQKICVFSTERIKYCN